MLTLLLGTDWTQNRAAVLKRIADDVHSQTQGLILMVPELISHDTERKLCAAAGDTASRYAEVLSFTRLARRVADSIGNSARECLDDGGRIVAMASAIHQVQSRLKAYASVGTRPEFLTGLVDAVDEFKRCCISSEDLMNASQQTEGNLAQKLEELALILEAYDSVCMRGKRDPRDQMQWLLEELENGDYAQNHIFYIDGFPDFTRQHMAILEHLICNAKQVTISLNCDTQNSRKLAFEKAGATAAEIILVANRYGIEYKVEWVEPRKDSLTVVREYLFQGTPDMPCNADLHVYRADSVYQECIATSEKILGLVRSGYRFRDISVVCADMEVYRNSLSMLFGRCGIPLYLSGTESILDKSVMNTVLSALDAALNGFEQSDVLRYLKTLFSPLDLQTCDLVENYVVLWGITRNKWNQEWTHHPDGLGVEFTDRSRNLLAQLNDARRAALEPLQELRNGFDNATNIGQQVMALYAFIEKINLAGHLEQLAAKMDNAGDNRNAQILNQLWEILLNALEQMYDVLGNCAWDAEAFSRLLRLLLSQYDVGTIPAALDAVTAGPVSAMRCQECKHLFVLGALEGALPGYGGATGVLLDHERVALRQMGVPLSGCSVDGLQAEFAEIYGVFCGAAETITVSCPTGQPSFLYQRLRMMASGDENSGYGLGPALFNNAEAAAFLAHWDAVQEADMLGLKDQFQSVKDKLHHQLGVLTDETTRKLYGDKLNLSASQIDRHADCRFSYFLKYGLRAKERKPATIDPAEFGTYVHAVLEQTAADVMAQGGFKTVSLEDAIKIAKKHSDTYARNRFNEFDSERLNYLFRRNAQELEMIVRELWDELHESDFSPVCFELGFGDNGQLPAIQIPSRSMQAQLCGLVDRVDCWMYKDRIYYRIVDYKTGKKTFDYCDVFNGLGLQMLLYLFALEQAEETVFEGKSIPAGVQYFPARAPMVSADDQLTQEEADAARAKLWKRKGLLLSDDRVLWAMEPSDNPIRLSYKRKKDGSISGDLADTGQFKLLNRYVFGLLGRMVDEIAAGQVAPNPYTRGNSHNACWFCPYGSICHSASLEGRRDYQAMSADRFWSEIEKEMKGNG